MRRKLAGKRMKEALELAAAFYVVCVFGAAANGCNVFKYDVCKRKKRVWWLVGFCAGGVVFHVACEPVHSSVAATTASAALPAAAGPDSCSRSALSSEDRQSC